ncbi:MAG: TolC family protein [Bacteroidales bacterium]|nr:TolC family protein [Bacteroidales bacterium]
MIKKTFSILLLLLGITLNMLAQPSDTLWLEQCQNAAAHNLPLYKNQELARQSAQLAIENIRATYLPQINGNAQATWQSAVIELPFSLPGVSVPQTPNEQYKITADVSQRIYDGSLGKKRKTGEIIRREQQINETENAIFQLNTQITSIFFQINLLKAQLKVVQMNQDILEARHMTCESAYRHGLKTKGECLTLKAEILKLQQNEKVIQSNLKSLAKGLSELSGLNVNPDGIFYLPIPPVHEEFNSQLRPEESTFSLQIATIDNYSDQLQSKLLPGIGGFLQAGYGNPGLNMLKGEADGWLMAGVKLSWTLWDWNQNRKDIQRNSVTQESIKNSRETWRRNLHIELITKLEEIDRYDTLLKSDTEIIESYSSLSREAFVNFENGTLTAADLIKIVGDEQNAILNREIHYLQSIYAKLQYNELQGLFIQPE